MNELLKRALLMVPPIRQRVTQLQDIRTLAESQRLEIGRLSEVIAKGRSPGLSASVDELLTERLLAHPARLPVPEVALNSTPATERSNRIRVAERLIRAYHKSLEEEKYSPMKREGEDLWTGLLRHELPDLMQSVDQRNPEALAQFLMTFGSSYMWFGGITTCIDGYNRNRDRKQIAISYLDKLVCLAESLGVLKKENPESGPWGENLFVDLAFLVTQIESELGIDIAPPLGVIHTDGLDTKKGVFHYRHINALYSAIRISRLNSFGGAVCEIGGGLGITAMYAQRLGIQRYTILDLPITCLLAGHYLLHAIGEDKVTLYGETRTADAGIELLPYWECKTMPSKGFGLTLNQDSLPEIADNLIVEFLNQIKRVSKDIFLSINHECCHPRTVRNFVRDSGGFTEVYRSSCWVREGYVEEAFRIAE